ncbi:MAG: phage tail tape measure protein [Gammaproteobacteria bacterium]|nr:phage tail tape measure protein [Gammaproteobacteria bacterium]
MVATPTVGDLLINAETKGVKESTREVDALATSAGRAERAVEGLDGQSARVSTSNERLGRTSRGANSGLLGLAAGAAVLGGAAVKGSTGIQRLTEEQRKSTLMISQFERGMEDAGDELARLDASKQKLRNTSIALTAAVVAGATAFAIFSTRAANAAIETDRLVGEVSALLSGSREDFDDIQQRALSLTAIFGGSLNENIQVFYQSISSGAANAAEAQQDFEVSARLAVAGSTSNLSALNAIIPVLNVYGREVITSSEASDVLFNTVRRGRTNIDQLGVAMSRVLPIAKSLGISFAEVAATFGAFTFAGLNTNETATTILGFLRAVSEIRPPSQNALNALGLDFDPADLREQEGYLRFILDFVNEIQRFDASSQNNLINDFAPDQAAQTFIRTLVASPATLERFREDVQDIGEAAGIVNTRFGQLSGTLAIRHKNAIGDITESYNRFGQDAAENLVPVLEIVAGRFDRLEGSFATISGVILGSLVAVAIPALIAGLVAIGGALVALGSTFAVATGGLSLLAGLVAGFVFTNLLSGTTETIVSMDTLTAATTDANDALIKFHNEGTRRAGEAALKAAIGVAELTLQVRKAKQEALADASDSTTGFFALFGGGTGGSALELGRLAAEVERAEAESAAAADEVDRLRRILGTELPPATSAAAEGTDVYSRFVAGAASETDDFADSVEDLAGIFENRLVQAIRSASDAIGDFAVSTNQSLTELNDNLGETLRQFGSGLISDTVNQAFQPANLRQGFIGAPTQAQAQAQAFTGVGFQARQAAFADPNSGLFGAGGILGTGVGSGSGFIGAVAAAIPPLTAFAAAVTLIPSLIGSTTVTDQGFRLGVNNGRVGGDRFETSTTTGLSGLLQFITTGSRQRTTGFGLTEAQARDAQLTFDPIIGRVNDVGDAFDVVFREVGVQSGANAREIADQYSNATIKQLEGITTLRRGSENLLETAERLVEASDRVNIGLGNVGLEEFERGIDGRLLAEAFGRTLESANLAVLFGSLSPDERLRIERESLIAEITRNLGADNPALQGLLNGGQFNTIDTAVEGALRASAERARLQDSGASQDAIQQQADIEQAFINSLDNIGRILNLDGASDGAGSLRGVSSSLFRNEEERRVGEAIAQSNSVISLQEAANRKLDRLIELGVNANRNRTDGDIDRGLDARVAMEAEEI